MQRHRHSPPMCQTCTEAHQVSKQTTHTKSHNDMLEHKRLMRAKPPTQRAPPRPQQGEVAGTFGSTQPTLYVQSLTVQSVDAVKNKCENSCPARKKLTPCAHDDIVQGPITKHVSQRQSQTRHDPQPSRQNIKHSVHTLTVTGP